MYTISKLLENMRACYPSYPAAASALMGVLDSVEITPWDASRLKNNHKDVPDYIKTQIGYADTATVLQDSYQTNIINKLTTEKRTEVFEGILKTLKEDPQETNLYSDLEKLNNSGKYAEFLVKCFIHAASTPNIIQNSIKQDHGDTETDSADVPAAQKAETKPAPAKIKKTSVPLNIPRALQVLEMELENEYHVETREGCRFHTPQLLAFLAKDKEVKKILNTFSISVDVDDQPQTVSLGKAIQALGKFKEKFDYCKHNDADIDYLLKVVKWTAETKSAAGNAARAMFWAILENDDRSRTINEWLKEKKLGAEMFEKLKRDMDPTATRPIPF